MLPDKTPLRSDAIMVNRKAPKALKQACLEALPSLFTAHIRKLVKRTDASTWFLKLCGQADVDRDQVLDQQVSWLPRVISPDMTRGGELRLEELILIKNPLK